MPSVGEYARDIRDALVRLQDNRYAGVKADDIEPLVFEIWKLVGLSDRQARKQPRGSK